MAPKTSALGSERPLDTGLALGLRALGVAALFVVVPAALIERSVLYRSEVPGILRAAGAFVEWQLLALLLLPVLALFHGARVWGPRWFGAAVALTLAESWLALSWGLFYGTGDFLSLESLDFARKNGGQLVKHFLEFSPLVTLGLPLGIAFSTAVVALVAKRPLPVGHRKKRVVLLGMLLALGMGLELGRSIRLGATTAFDAAIVTGDGALVADKWRRYLQREVGPLTLLVNLALGTTGGDGQRWPSPLLPLPEHRRNVVRFEDYFASAKGAKRSHVILVVVESLRHDVLTMLGGQHRVMPHLEALAKESLVMARAYAQATHSSYADPTIVSGQHPLRSWTYRDYPEDIRYPRVLLWDLLGPRGYRTAIISSQNEHWGGMLNFLRTPSLDHLFHSETFHGSYVPDGDSGFAEWAEQFKRSGKVDDADTMNELIRFVRESNEPIAVYTNLQNSHFPYRYPPEAAPFQPATGDFGYTFAHIPKDKLPVVENRYRNALYFVDGQIGRLVDTLKSTGKWDDTILIVTGDTGQAFFEHGRGGHGTTPYEELVHVPFVVHAPGLEPRISERLSQQADILPTILDLLDMPPHPALSGSSMLGDVTTERPVFTIVQMPILREIAVIEGHHKLIVDGEGKRELYDLRADPRETKNLWREDPERGARLLNMVLSFRKTQLSYYADESRWDREYVPSLFP